jgi:hypothetical protein
MPDYRLYRLTPEGHLGLPMSLPRPLTPAPSNDPLAAPGAKALNSGMARAS